MEEEIMETVVDVTHDDASSEEGEVTADSVMPSRSRLGFSFSAYKMPQRNPKAFTTWETLLLGYQSLGVVYGDLGTSPLYVFSSIKLEEPTERDLLGILSIIFWTLTLMGLLKYVLIVLQADDHGEGGTFALYTLLRQHLNFKSEMVMSLKSLDSDSNLEFHSRRSSITSKAQKFLEESTIAQKFITYIVLLGTCMVIGDGALTPAISVLSAVQGIQSRSPTITQTHVVWMSVAILLVLFLFQRFGTNKVSFLFSPIMILWFGFTAIIGVYNIVRYYPPVLKAISPHYMFYFFADQKSYGWSLLGAIALCITGAEAMFADLGHFSKGAIQLAFCTTVYPSLILSYAGEASYLIKNPGQLSTTFYSSVPEPLFWPMFVISTLAAVVASQALISASFSIIRQSTALGCFPRVTMIHTSKNHEGQVYSPEVNYFLMIACILITVGFKGGAEIGNAFGVAVIWVMLITTFLITVVMIVVWQANIALALLFFSVFTIIEGVYMTSLLNKLLQGGWVPFAISAIFIVITLTWTYGRSKKAQYEAKNMIDRKNFEELMTSTRRVPGVCFFCTDLMNGIPPIVRHYTELIGSVRNVTVFVTVRTLPVRSVLPDERFNIGKLGQSGVYRCLVQFGYMDVHSMEGNEFAESVIAAFREAAEDEEEKKMLDAALQDGIVFVLGRVILRMTDKQGRFRQLVINNFYRFLQKNFRSNVATLKIPPGKHLQVGMLYEI
ncbi:Potassium transporter [Rhynchospora pubera]|uniref:Potassium transporter n=1 Tax=Rhynchospora pubera TaxID=906938 RepID=A0AAV8CCY2_9POAL|nr:Potassium transporter [Rhynchospora pubera]KAJ4793949.1 Potassium transporter [Rhynchospora pubera]